MRPIDLGGLGIHNLEIMGWALQMRWLWIEKTRPDRSWAGLEVPVHPNTAAMFAILVVTTVGNGRNTLFWTDRWLHGCCLKDLAPNVLSCVPSKIRRTRTIFEAMQDHTWVRDIRNTLGWHGLLEYLKLWNIIAALELNTTADFHQWKFELEVSILPDQPKELFCWFHHLRTLEAALEILGT